MLVVFCPSLVVDHIEMYELLQPFVELSKPILLAQAAQLSAHALRSRDPGFQLLTSHLGASCYNLHACRVAELSDSTRGFSISGMNFTPHV